MIYLFSLLVLGLILAIFVDYKTISKKVKDDYDY